MSLPSPILDDRSYEQLRKELIERIPIYAKEWSDHNPSDPGITLIELFAFLGESLFFRFNQIPETVYLEFLNLLQIPRRPATCARTLLTLTSDDLNCVLVEKGSEAKAGNISFETRNEVRVLPVSFLPVVKARCEAPDDGDNLDVSQSYDFRIEAVKNLDSDVKEKGDVVCYETRKSLPLRLSESVDNILWIAVLAGVDEPPDDVRKAIISHEEAPLLLNVGFVPEIMESLLEDIKCCRERVEGTFVSPVEWQISTHRILNNKPVYRSLEVLGDTTRGLSREGIVRLQLPRSEDDASVFEFDDPELEGTGDFPPRIDDDEIAEKVLFWIRAFRHDESRFEDVLQVLSNATEVHQCKKANMEFLGTGTAQANQQYALVNKPVVEHTLKLQVEGPDGWDEWKEVEGFHLSSESGRHYILDRDSGEIRFGNGIQGYPPQIGQRIRAVEYSYGGGEAGNVAPGSITKLLAYPTIKPSNSLPGYGGSNRESIAEALDRIPGELRRRDRAVTEGDFRELALTTPTVNIGRAECLPRFHPKIPRETEETEHPGVVTVVVWPKDDPAHPNAPVPDRRILRCVCEWLDTRRLVTTELYVIPPVYKKIAISVGIEVKPGYGIEAVRRWVELIIRQYVAPLPPFGPEGNGWPLGKKVYGPELEAAALQVEGVEYIQGLDVAELVNGQWVVGKELEPPNTVGLDITEVPELTEITVVKGSPVVPGEPIEPPEPKKPPVPIPKPKKVC